MIKYRALEDLSHDPKLAEALGNMVVVWAHAEIVLFATLARVADISLNMAMSGYYHIPTFEARTKFIVALLRDWNPGRFDNNKIQTSVKKLAKLASTRNHWVHGDWCANADKSETLIFNHRVPVESKNRRKPVKAADVLNHCRAVKKRASDLAELIDWEKLEA